MAFVLEWVWTKRRRRHHAKEQSRVGDLSGLKPLPRGSAKLPYAGITRIRFEGTVSTG
jgi:hypothetical protein